MSILFDAKLAPTDAQTHALVIGVGAYPHLLSGSLSATQAAVDAFGLGQLDSPPLSAIAFVNWLRGPSGLSNKKAPLGTIDVLLSPGTYRDPSGTERAVDLPTMEMVENAYGDWVNRSSANANNVAIFYFCGHGLEKDVTILLPADFGNPKRRNIGTNMIDLTRSRISAIKECAARTQIYFVDACRESPVGLLQLDVPPAALFSTKKLQWPQRAAPVLYAANSGLKAHAPAGAISYFTSALIECFSKFGAQGQNAGVWQVTTSSIARAMQHRMSTMKVAGLPPLSCSIGGDSNFDEVLHTFKGDAYVMSPVDCDPSEALKSARFSIRNAAAQLDQWGPQEETRSIEVVAGQYDVSATFGGAYQDVACNQLMSPPVTPCTLETRP